MGIRCRQGGYSEAIAMSLQRDDSSLAQGSSSWSGVVRRCWIQDTFGGEADRACQRVGPSRSHPRIVTVGEAPL